MSVYSGPEIPNDGLVFAYDMTNTEKSWKGAPTTNLLTNGNFSNGVIAPFGSYNVTPITVSGLSPLPYPNYRSNYVMQFTSTTGTSGTSLNVSGMCTVGQIYTFSFYGRLVSGPANPVQLNFNNQNGSGDTNAWNSNVVLSDVWQKFTFTFTCDVAKTTLYFYVGAAGYVCQFTDFQLEQLSVASSFVNGTRTNTQAILDQTNNRTITVNSLTYTNERTFSFNGSTNYITTTNTGITHGTTNFSYSCWAKWSGKPSLGTLFENGNWSSSFIIRFETNGITIYSMANYYGKFSFDPTLSIWYHLAFVRNGNNIELYINGVFSSSLAFGSNVNIVPNTNLIFIGMSQHSAGQCFNGQIGNVQIHSRALSAAEVQQNFNAMKGRYFGYQIMLYTASNNVTLTNNGTQEVTMFKRYDNGAWNGEVRSTETFSAPCTIEFNKQAGATDNGTSYAMIGWNEDPTTNTNYTSIDHASYPFMSNTYEVYNNGVQTIYGTWDVNKRFYIVYDTDGFIRHYNGSTLLYSANYGTNKIVYVDSSLYSVNSTFGGFSNVKVARSSWNGTNYV